MMIIAMKGIQSRRQLRRNLQDEAGLSFPQAVHIELLVLYDVYRCLEFNIFQCREVLGEVGWAYVNGYLERQIELKA